MKRIVIISIISVMLLSVCLAAGCSSVNQLNLLSVGWTDYEQYVYNVYEGDSTTAIGTMTYTFQRLVPVDGQVKCTVGDKEYTVSSGALIITDLNITGGQYAGETMTSTVLVGDKLQSIASYKEYRAVDEQRSYITSVDYGTDKKATITINGQSAQFKKGTTCYDNDSLYTLVRASDFGVSSYGLAVTSTDNLQGSTRNVSIAMISANAPVTCDFKIDPNAFENTPIECYQLRVLAQAAYGNGTAHYLYFAKTVIEQNKGDVTKKLKKVLVKIQEGNYSYVLSSISLDRPAEPDQA